MDYFRILATLNLRQFDVRNYFINDTDVVLVRSTIYKLTILAQQYRMDLYVTTLLLIQGESFWLRLLNSFERRISETPQRQDDYSVISKLLVIPLILYHSKLYISVYCVCKYKSISNRTYGSFDWTYPPSASLN